MNLRAVIAQLGQVGIASRADLSKATHISQPTVGKIIDDLLAQGVVEEVDAPAATSGSLPGRLGRPGRLLRLDTQQPRFLAIQLGVRETRLAVLPISVVGPDHFQARFPTAATSQDWMRDLQSALQSLAPCWPESSSQPWGILVSIPGVVDEAAGRILLSPNLHWLQQVHLLELLRPLSPAPICFVQEIRALALGQLALHPQTPDFFLVDFGQGLGSAPILANRLYTGPLPLSGELGHTPVPGNQRVCGCGAVGCVETLVSRHGILQSFQAQGGSPQWDDLVHALRDGSLPDWLRPALDAVAATIAGAINVLGIPHVILTGDLLDLGPAVMHHVCAAVQKGGMWARFGQITCQTAPRYWCAGLVRAGIDRLLLSPQSSLLTQTIRSPRLVLD